jgi:hypothetical protein
MDIFTTVLTRVVPTPIKPTSLKVKALLKEAGTGKLKEDLDHIENHDYYFGNDKSNKNNDEENESLDAEQVESTNDESAEKKQGDTSSEDITVSKDGVKHLDLYV